MAWHKSPPSISTVLSLRCVEIPPTSLGSKLEIGDRSTASTTPPPAAQDGAYVTECASVATHDRTSKSSGYDRRRGAMCPGLKGVGFCGNSGAYPAMVAPPFPLLCHYSVRKRISAVRPRQGPAWLGPTIVATTYHALSSAFLQCRTVVSHRSHSLGRMSSIVSREQWLHELSRPTATPSDVPGPRWRAECLAPGALAISGRQTPPPGAAGGPRVTPPDTPPAGISADQRRQQQHVRSPPPGSQMPLARAVSAVLKTSGIGWISARSTVPPSTPPPPRTGNWPVHASHGLDGLRAVRNSHRAVSNLEAVAAAPPDPTVANTALSGTRATHFGRMSPPPHSRPE